MTRLVASNPNSFNPDQEKAYRRFPSNLTQIMAAYAPAQVTNYLNLGDSFRHGNLSDREREFTIIRIGTLANSNYELMQHTPIAQAMGWTGTDINAIQSGMQAHFDRHFATLMAFIDAVFYNHTTNDSIFNRMQKEFSNDQIAELLLLIGHYTMTANFLNTLDVDLDDTPTPWDN